MATWAGRTDWGGTSPPARAVERHVQHRLNRQNCTTRGRGAGARAARARRRTGCTAGTALPATLWCIWGSSDTATCAPSAGQRPSGWYRTMTEPWGGPVWALGGRATAGQSGGRGAYRTPTESHKSWLTSPAEPGTPTDLLRGSADRSYDTRFWTKYTQTQVPVLNITAISIPPERGFVASSLLLHFIV